MSCRGDRLWGLILVVGLALAAPLAAAAGLDDAQRALDEQRWADAEAAYRARLLEDPASLPSLLGWARALAGQGRGAEAVPSLRRGAERALDLGDYAGAVELLELAVAAQPQAATQARLGQALMLDRRFESAEGHLRAAWEAGERSPRDLLYFAACLWENGQPEEAEARYREAIGVSRGSGVAVYELGRLLLWLGRSGEAAASIQQAIERGQDGLAVRLDLARALEGVARQYPGRAPEAVAAYRDVVELAPQHSEVRYGLARSLLLAGQREEAERELQSYRILQAEDQERARVRGQSEARSARARELVAAGRLDEAESVLEGLPDLASVWHARAVLLRARGEIAGAITALERALALDGARPDLAALLAELRTASGLE